MRAPVHDAMYVGVRTGTLLTSGLVQVRPCLVIGGGGDVDMCQGSVGFGLSVGAFAS